MAVASEPVVKQKSEKDKLKEMFPGLCRPDNPAPVSLSEISTYIVTKQVRLNKAQLLRPTPHTQRMVVSRPMLSNNTHRFR